MQTTPSLLRVLEVIEGYREKAYDDKQPHRDLNPGDEHIVKGVVTVGMGSTRINGRAVRLGDTMTRQQAFDAKKLYIIENIEPALERLFAVPLTGHQADALGSLIYNFGPDALVKWRLVKLINSKASAQKIAKEWVTDTYSSGGEPMLGLYRRRIAEVLMFFNLDWRAGMNVDWADDVIDVLSRLGWKASPWFVPTLPTLPKPKPKKEPVMAGTEDFVEPEFWDKLTPKQQTEYLNLTQAARLKTEAPAKASAPVVKKVLTVDTSAMKTDARPKAMEESTTFKGLSKQESGKEAMIVGGVMTGVATTMPTANALTGYFEKYSTNSIIIAGLVVGGVIALVGAWRWWAGRNIAYEGRQTATQPKV